MKKILTLMTVVVMSVAGSAYACPEAYITVINKSDNCVKFFAGEDHIGTVNPSSWGTVDSGYDLKEIRAVGCQDNESDNKGVFMTSEITYPVEQIVYPNDFNVSVSSKL